MTGDDDDDVTWPPALLARQFQEAGEEAVKQQSEFVRQLFESSKGAGLNTTTGLAQLAAASMGTAMFKERVQSGGRISIPDAEREALDIAEGDIVQTVIVPVKRTQGNSQ